MIDKIPETTTLQCTLPKQSVERVRLIAERRQISLDEAVAAACDRWAQEQECLGTTTASPQAAPTPTPKASLPVVEIWPDPPCCDEGELIPVELPQSSGIPITVTRMSDHWPERLDDSEA